MPEHDTVLTGDSIYFERILGVGDPSSITHWPAACLAREATGAAHMVPGHGAPTTMERTPGDIIAAPGIGQSAFAHLEQFGSLADRNAQTTFGQMESE